MRGVPGDRHPYRDLRVAAHLSAYGPGSDAQPPAPLPVCCRQMSGTSQSFISHAVKNILRVYDRRTATERPIELHLHSDSVR